MKIIHGDCLEVLKTLEDNSVDSIVTDPPYGLSFMGKHWDYDVPSVEIWQECLRVLKPGGYLLAFAGTRTQHRMAIRIEDAGFEIRDMIAWIYGSGFPKSLNIGKAVDKLQGNEREDLGESEYASRASKSQPYGQGEIGAKDERKITKGTSEWEGWGTALKPALEPITVARKPLAEKTVAENCLKWGVGGINIDECRVGTEEEIGRDNRNIKNSPLAPKDGWNENSMKGLDTRGQQSGRFPANLIHDGSDEVVGLFPNSKSTQGKNVKRKDCPNTAMSGRNYARFNEVEGYSDSGSASRFFYCAKASKSERNKGCEELEEKTGIRTNAPRENENIKTPTRTNNHPTVKPIALMEYLIKLVSREGSTVLDPFMGSGSTGIAAKKLNRDFIGIERDADYLKIAEARINNLQNTLL